MATSERKVPTAGARIIVPAGIYAPTSYADNADGKRCARGTVVESGHLVAVRFDGYPNVVDYSRREAARFAVTIPGVSFVPGADSTEVA